MDVVYVVGRHDPELRYSLRSLKHVDHDRVWIVSKSLPGWVRNVEWLEAPEPARKARNIIAALLTAAECDDISEDFAYFNDDFYAVKPTEIPLWYHGTLERYNQRISKRSNLVHRETKCVTRQLLVDSGLPLRNYELHVPMVFNREKLAETIGQVGRLEIQTRSVYGNMWDIGGTEHSDVKTRKLWTDDREWVSTGNTPGFKGPVADRIKELFPDPSPYENLDPVGAVRSPAPGRRSGLV